MASPETLPVKASVSGIGLVIDTFQETSSPLAVPSNISVDWSSAPCVPVSVPPVFFSVSVALRSPIGVLMVIFQFPSTAISRSPQLFVRKTGMVLGQGWLGGIAHLPPKPNVENGSVRARSNAGRAYPVCHKKAKCDILHGERHDLRADQNHRNIKRPQLEIAG